MSRSHILETVEGSLSRLGTDYLDILYIHHVDIETSAKGTAEIVIVEDDLFGRPAEHRGGGGAGAGLHLRPHPQGTAIGLQMHGTVQRLHRRVRDKRQFIISLDPHRAGGGKRRRPDADQRLHSHRARQ